MKKSPFSMSNQGETVDEHFFLRLNKFENYYKNHAVKNKQFKPNYNAMVNINELLQSDLISLVDIQNAIEIYNKTTSGTHHGGTGWLDLRLHLRHIAFVYGKEYKTDRNLNLIE